MSLVNISENLIKEVLGIAEEAGQSILEVYNMDKFDSIDVSYKKFQDPVTQADLNAHQIIKRRLSKISNSIPVVSEEDYHGELNLEGNKQFWLVDPLDGTKEFLARNGEFTVNIALIQNGKPHFGVVLVPVRGDVYWGGLEFGSFSRRNNITKQIKVTKLVESSTRNLRVVVSHSHINEATIKFIEELGSGSERRGVEIIRTGSSLKFCNIAEGTADIYPRLGPTSEWDTAAAHAVVEGAGGFVMDLTGASLKYGKKDILNPSFISSSMPVEYWQRKVRAL